MSVGVTVRSSICKRSLAPQRSAVLSTHMPDPTSLASASVTRAHQACILKMDFGATGLTNRLSAVH